MTKDDRARAIEDAAYAVLAEKGFKGTSMLAVARAARASNETMYKWYGDKIGLFTAMITRNSETVSKELAKVRSAGQTGWPALEAAGRALLTMVTGDRAIALNRAAAADVTGALGAALSKGGRDKVAPLVSSLIKEVFPAADDIGERTEAFLSLLIGDLQIRRAIGTLPALTEAEVMARVNRAMTLFERIYAD